jgi:hypothetical protein
MRVVVGVGLYVQMRQDTTQQLQPTGVGDAVVAVVVVGVGAALCTHTQTDTRTPAHTVVYRVPACSTRKLYTRAFVVGGLLPFHQIV